MEQGLSGKRVLVTGGTKGIGRAVVLALAEAGASVVTCYGHDDDAAELITRELGKFGDQHQVVRADITDAVQARRLVDLAREAFGGLDVLVNNVGVDGVVPFEELEPKEWSRVMDHNVNSVYLVTHAAQSVLVDGGSIVTVGASVGLRGRARGVHYTASKAALVGFTRALAKDLGERAIRVNLVAPGLTETEPGAGLPAHMVERIISVTALKRLGQPEDVAGAVLFLAGDSSRFVSGTVMNVDGGV
jgi:3-oxoacyl-[acyl-carrier protein] reductase